MVPNCDGALFYEKLVIRNRKTCLFKGIVQPFELGGVTRVIRSAVKNWWSGRSGPVFFFKFNDKILQKEHKPIFSSLRISKMTFRDFSVPRR